MSAREYEPVIGVEIHVQLATRTKMFCGCELSFGEEPNTRTCPVCLAHPGALPVTNAEAVHFGLMIGLALGCEIAPRSIFHRKNYFYPDSPKAYQISQYDVPLCSGGRLGDVRIHRVHLEEDAAKLVHAGSSGRIHGAESSVVDFNRCGTPLVEIVTEPDLRSAAEAADFGRLLQATLRSMGVSDVNMEEGSLRVDANVSIRPAGETVYGTKTELKNMNSFRFLERGIDAEIARQTELVADGGEVEQETLHFDPTSGSLTSLRSKEEAHDYRYFPEPDLVPLAPTDAMVERARGGAPRAAGRPRRAPRARAGAAARDREAARLPHRAGRLLRGGPGGGRRRPAPARELDDERADRRARRPRSRRHRAGARRLRPAGGRGGGEADLRRGRPRGPAAGWSSRATSRRRSPAPGWWDEDELEAIVERAIAGNADAVEKIRAGKGQAVGAIVGAVMRETKGRADGGEVQRLIQAKLGV